MAFDAFSATGHIRDDYIAFLLDRTFGRFPAAGAEDRWDACREQMRRVWTDGDPGRGVTPLLSEPLSEPLFPFLRPDPLATLDRLGAAVGQGPTEARPLHPRLVELLQQSEMGDWDFMSHQVDAFAKTVVSANGGQPGNGQSIVVSSGTGSGKTECFLIPMLNRMFWLEDEAALRTPGVRVLIVYPMNALVNNQLKRLRRLLSSPVAQNLGISFGAYTGKTAEQMTDAELNSVAAGELRSMYEMRNFRKDRMGIRAAPPHILVTNYSMLEYMLLRPRDQPIFPDGGSSLQTIVLDEAHTYAGSLGSDIALLLRRVALRFGTDMGQVLGIATSATLADSGQEERLRDIGVGLFSKQPEQVAVITGTRVLPSLDSTPHIAAPLDAYALTEQEWLALGELQTLDPDTGQARTVAQEQQRLEQQLAGVGLDDLFARLGLGEPDAVPIPGVSESVESRLHRLFASHQVTVGLREAAFAAGRPCPLAELVRCLSLEPEVLWERRAAETLLQLMSRARRAPGMPVFLPMKLHVYVRTPPQTYSDLSMDSQNPLGHLFGVPEVPTGKPLLFPAYCAGKQRKEVYFAGSLCHEIDALQAVDRLLLHPQGARVPNAVPVVFRLATPDDPNSAVFGLMDTGDGLLEVGDGGQNGFVLATAYGSEALMTCQDCLDNPPSVFWAADGTALDLAGDVDDGDEGDNGDEGAHSVLRPLGQSGRDLADVILFEALLPHLPAKRREDGTAVDGNDNYPTGVPRRRDTASAGRGSIIFADTRQGAAWRAASVQNSHTRDVVRRCIYQYAVANAQPIQGMGLALPANPADMTLQQLMAWHQQAQAAAQNQEGTVYVVNVRDIWLGLAADRAFRSEVALRPGLQARLFPEGLANGGAEDDWVAATRALVAAELLIPLRTGRALEAMGLLRSHYDGAQLPQLPGDLDPIFNDFAPVEKDSLLQLIGNEQFRAAWHPFLAQALDYMRRGGGVLVNWAGRDADALAVEPLGRTRWRLNRLHTFDGAEANGRGEGLRSFAGDNMRSYARRLLDSFEEGALGVNADVLLRLVFRLLLRRAQQGNTLLVQRVSAQGEELLAISGEALCFQVFRADLQIAAEHPRLLTRLFRNEDPAVSTDHRAGETDLYGALTTAQEQAYKRSRDFHTFSEAEPMGIRAMEHTAQIHSAELANVEERFLKGELNLLSCSTTMELGIDIGDLVSVLLGNLPPESASYIQRAGRAGRRDEGTALVLAVLRDNPYDLSVFRDPGFMYDRPVRVAPVDLADERQVRRHVHSLLLTQFFRRAGIGQNSPLFAWADCETFFGCQDRLSIHALDLRSPAPCLADLHGWDGSLTCLCDLCCKQLSEGEESLEALLAGTCLEDADAGEIRQSLACRLRELQWEYETDYQDIEAQWHAANGAPATQAAIGVQRRQLRRENLVGYLARGGVIPRYGFPIDVIPLITRNCTDPDVDAYWDRAADQNHQGNRNTGDLRRSIDLALAEYVPGARVIVNQQVYTSQGMTLNCYDPQTGPFERFFFVVCSRCGHFQTGRGIPRSCEACGHETNWQSWAPGAAGPILDAPDENAMQTALAEAAEASGGGDPAEPLPSIVRSYIKPRAFSVEYSRRPVATSYHESRPYTASLRCVSINTAEQVLTRLGSGEGSISFAFVPDQSILYFNAGRSPRRAAGTAVHGYGYRVCLACGYSEPEEGYDRPPSWGMQHHRKLTEHVGCPGPSRTWANVILGAEARTDVLILRLPNSVLAGQWDAPRRTLATTFMTALRMAAARILEVDNRFIGGQIQEVRQQDGTAEGIDILLFDAGAGDTGYMSRLQNQPLNVIQEAIGYLACPEAAEEGHGGLCRRYCHRCLLSYDSVWYAQRGLLDRAASRAWIEATSAEMLGGGHTIDEQQVGRTFGMEHALRFGSGSLRVFLPFLTGESVDSSEHLLRRLHDLTIRREGCRVSILLPRRCLEDLGPGPGFSVRSQLWQWAQSSQRFEVRTSMLDELPGFPHFRLAVNDQEYSLDDPDIAVDFTVPGSRPVAWFVALEGNGGSGAFEALWNVSDALPQPDLPETTVRLDIPAGTDATALAFLYQQLASHPRIQLERLLVGRQVVRLTYQDRYLRGPHTWRNLISFMRQLPLAPTCEVGIVTMEKERACGTPWRVPAVTHAQQVGQIVVHRNADFEEGELCHVMSYLAEECQLDRHRCRIGVLCHDVRGTYAYSLQQRRHIWVPGWGGEEHARKMLCLLDDGSGFSLMFDQGMDWAIPRDSYRYSSVSPNPNSPRHKSLFDETRPYLTGLSYAVFRRGMTPSESDFWALCDALSPQQVTWY